MNQVTTNEFNEAVKIEVEKQLSSREEAEARLEAEEALKEAKETFETLKASLETKNVKIAEYEEVLSNLDVSEPTTAEVAANEKIVELETSIEEWKHRTEVAEAALDTLAREETAAGRMSELEEAGIALDNDEAKTQYTKIRDMSDENFQSYKNELTALKSKYVSSSEEEDTETIEISELSSEEINLIAQSLGCDPSDAKCISLVREVAQKVAEVSHARQQPVVEEPEVTKVIQEPAPESTTPKKETASIKKTLSLGEAITKAMDQDIQAPVGLKEEMTQAWENYYAEKRKENNSK